MEFKLPYEIKESILSDILSFNNPFGLTEGFTIVEFLLKFLDLKNMPSEDSRFKNAYEDAVQHL